MNIALVRQRYTAFGGAERFVSSAVRALQAQGADVTIVTRRWESANGLRARICNPFHIGSVWRDWGFARAVCRLLGRERFDLVQSHERIACCDIYRAGDGVHREWLNQRRRVLGRWRRLGLALNPYHRYTLAAERKLFASPQLKAVICNSRMVRDEIRAYFGLPEDKLHVIYSGVDGSLFHPGLREEFGEPLRESFGIAPQVPVFLFVGSGFARKGLAPLLRSLPAGVHLLVVGTDKRAAAYRKLAGQLGIAARVHFAGGQKDVRPFYAASDLLVLPTLYDPFPNAALEALACGLPVLTSAKSGAAEVIREGENGYVCDALDETGLAARMAAYLRTPRAGREEMRARARRTVAGLTLEAMGETLVDLYRTVLADPHMR